MKTANESKSLTVSAADGLRDVYGRHAAKKVARAFGRSVATAKFWLSGGIPERELPLLWMELEAEIAREEARLAARRRQIEEDRDRWRGGKHGVTVLRAGFSA